MQVVEGSTLDDGVIAEAARAAAAITDPPSDIRATAEYRRHLTAVYVKRVLRQLREEWAAEQEEGHR
jgi:carbon-monoxide dehydrogenase medium subunit